jgi:hypothetical protein
MEQLRDILAAGKDLKKHLTTGLSSAGLCDRFQGCGGPPLFPKEENNNDVKTR